MGPFDRWPTGHGFDYFYGFLAGETSQWEPRLVENTTAIEPPHDKNYHLSEDMAQRSIDWLRKHRAFSPDKPFFLYWAPGAAHGPHQVGKEWSDKYKGKFDTGWDAYRERVFARQKQLGWIPANTKLTPRTATMPAWDSIPAAQRPFQLRLMEIYAGFVEHVDAQVGKVIDELERLGVRDNTIVIYIFGDNGASAEGQNGTISELLAQNGIPNTVEQQIAALNTMGGLDLLGGPKTDSMYHAGWAWAGNTPFQYTKLIASHFGGTRNPMVISWPQGIKPDKTPRAQFHHVNDIAPTIYELIGIKPPTMVDGFQQDPIDGVSLAYTFANAQSPTRKKVQYFDNNGSRAIFQDGWLAATFGPLVPWLPGAPGLSSWDSAKDKWELYNLNADFSEADDLAAREPQRLAQLQKTFDQQAVANKVYPLGAGIWLRLHPEDRIKSPYRSWQFDATTTRMPEFTAPGLGRESNTVSIDADLNENASGVLYALGGSGGGLSLYLDQGQLVYEYNMMIIECYTARSKNKIPAGRHRIEVTTTLASAKPLSPAEVVLNVDGREVARTTAARTVPAAFSASETFDVGVDLGSTVSLDYFERRPFRFDGTIRRVDVKMN
jgi:arylsulfatase